MKPKTTNEERIGRLEKTVIQLQQHIFALNQAIIIGHNQAIDRAAQKSGSILDGIL